MLCILNVILQIYYNFFKIKLRIFSTCCFCINVKFCFYLFEFEPYLYEFSTENIIIFKTVLEIYNEVNSDELFSDKKEKNNKLVFSISFVSFFGAFLSGNKLNKKTGQTEAASEFLLRALPSSFQLPSE